MKKGILSLLTWSLPFLLLAQADTSHGIKWAEGLTWEQVKQKAKEENKYIFLDCFTTWCGPCHAMDKDVYPNEKVGEAINEKFISVKVQMDKTSYDKDAVKKWYDDAVKIQKNYTVNAFPTFLFFSPDGKPLHRGVGYREASEFISLTSDALNPEKQYYALLNDYKPGKIDTSELKGLARALRSLGGDLASKMAVEYLSRIPKSEISNPDNLTLIMQFGSSQEMQKIATEYISKLSPKLYLEEYNLKLITTFRKQPSVSDLMLSYIDGLKKEQLTKQLSLLLLFTDNLKAKPIADKYISSLNNKEIYTKENILFINGFTKSSTDLGFQLFKENGGKIDSVIGYKNYANTIVGNVIIMEEYDSCFKDAIKADIDNVPWEAITKTVEAKYGRSMAKRVDLQVRSSLYKYFAEKTGKYWAQYIKYYIDKIEKNGYDTTHPQIQFLDALNINNFVFNAIFYHSDDTGQMKIGLRWMEGVLRRNTKEPNNMDTYANLLYKIGRKEEAIEWEDKAVKLAIEVKKDWLLPSLQSNLAKMKQGVRTWTLSDKKELDSHYPNFKK